MASACDGSWSEVPKDFPALGDGCRSHLVYRWHNKLWDSNGFEDVASLRGVRRLPAPNGTTWDLGVAFTDGRGAMTYSSAWLFLPSLDVGVYRGSERATATYVSPGTRQHYDRPSGVRVEILGRSERAVWGRFLMSVCYDYEASDCFRAHAGRFAAAIDSEPSALELGAPRFLENRGAPLCDSAADCPSYGVCAIVTCSASNSGCVVQTDQSKCPADQYCGGSGEGDNLACLPK